MTIYEKPVCPICKNTLEPTRIHSTDDSIFVWVCTCWDTDMPKDWIVKEEYMRNNDE